MFKMDLPRTAATTRLQDALKLMKKRQRAGLVYDLRGQTVLVELSAILSHLREHGNVTLEELPSALPAPAVSEKLTSEAQKIASAEPGYMSDADFPGLRTAFAATKADCLVVAPARKAAHVVTVSETFAAILARPIVLCTCEEVPTHVWQPEDLLVAGQCNKDGSPVRCS